MVAFKSCGKWLNTQMETTGAPWGSGLGPGLFNIFVSDWDNKFVNDSELGSTVNTLEGKGCHPEGPWTGSRDAPTRTSKFTMAKGKVLHLVLPLPDSNTGWVTSRLRAAVGINTLRHW